MATSLKVDELRTELAQRGLSTTGTKPTLARRLQAALTKENKQAADSGDHGKRERDLDTPNGDSDGPSKLKAFDKFRKLGIQQLREEAQRRGISSSGSKKELLERLCCGDAEEEPATANELAAKEEAAATDEVKTEKLITATKKGVAVLDQWLPDHIKANYHVLQQGDDVYDAMLNQTNVGDNNNKFFAIQLLESDDGAAFMVYYRWGRVGVRGQDKLQGPYTSQGTAINEFVQKFYAKTRNHWFNRKEFICYPKCYTWLEMDYGGKEEQEVSTEPAVTTSQLRESKLESRIAKFLSLICNISMMKQQMMEIGYNAEKLPLGKLSKSTILKGYDVLKRIADLIGQSDRKKLEQLSSEFYTVIPHDFGFKKMREFVIDTPQKLKSKLEMVEALGEIEVASKLLRDDIGTEEDPLYARYQRLGCKLTPLEVGSQEYMLIATYMHNTHAKTHSSYTVDIVQIFRVSREVETELFSKFSSTSNRMLLWHGSRLTNWTGILSQGLRIAPPEAPATGYMFGKGVYFADMFSKSANYCFANSAATAGVLLLCEVALGDMVELLHAKYDADKLPAGKLSTKGVGATSPDPSEAQALEDGVVVPLGRPKEQSDCKGALLYNEYIVYNVDQIRMRYVVQVNFNIQIVA
ncbi:poly [ADP-ribose] polymerase 2 isoform X2 [Rhodamnia argentea]|uniref:Poly [ADP-ribose] polymerase n=1 Tax=Rhodamnia argentea TaxID=178133 RepID=A0A8B8Q837_9MYRT|nr:poly [ADP-ribose] polymerase 2 isoform X2 [Rhodamnia argentea]